ncbi:MAG TPA: TlpA disulfide reductase family protein [Sphingobacteriaceae bacterium]
MNEIVVNEVKESPYVFSNTQVLNSVNNTIYRKIDSLSKLYYRQYAQPIPGTKSGRSLPGTKQQELFTEQLKLLSNYPNSIVSLIEIYSIASMATMQDKLDLPMHAYRALSDELMLSPLGQEFYNKISKRLNGYNAAKVGSRILKFSVETDNGRSFTNTQLSGQPYIIAFSATWCMPCQEELPELKRLYDKYKSKGLKVIYFNMDDKVAKWKEHIDKNNLTWINVSEKTKMISSEIAKMFHIYAVPTTLLVDKDGMIVYNSDSVENRMAVLNAKLQKLL